MFQITGVLTILILFGFFPEVFSKTSEEKYPHPIFKPFEHNCTGNYKGKKPSNEEILHVLKAHSKWLKNPKAPDEYRANFCEADLEGANLNEAMLAGANFAKAELHNAQLKEANLTRANFSEAQLHGAILDDAMLHLAILHKAVLQGASLKNAMLYQANLQGADLRNVKGLTQYQINMACMDQHTKLPRGLSHPKPCS
jgi:uncharacterized protein YjbI with pentapeptide repeats